MVLNSATQQACVPLPIVNDLEIEGNEQFTVTAAIASVAGTFELVRAETLVTILDDRKSAYTYSCVHVLTNDLSNVSSEPLFIGFEFPEYTVNESGGAVEVCVLVMQPPILLLTNDTFATIMFSTRDESAVGKLCSLHPSNNTCISLIIQKLY